MTNLNEYALELQRHQITWETCRGGQQYETIFVVTDEDYLRETESFIGYILEDEQYGNVSFSQAYKFGFDGLIYATRIDEAEVEKVVGSEKLAFLKKKMVAIADLINAQVDMEQAALKAEWKEFEDEEVVEA